MQNSGPIIVTGATGFIGAALVQGLLSDGHRVIALARGALPPAHPRLAVVPIEAALSEDQSDPMWTNASAVVHLASRNHRRGERGRAHADAYRRDILDLTERIAAAARRNAVPRFIYLSTIKVSDAAQTGEAAAEDVDPYTFYKRKAEQALGQLMPAGSPTQFAVLRPPLVYHADARGNFGALVRLARSGLPLPLPATTGRRAMIARSNLVDAILTVLKLDATRFGAMAGGYYDIGDGRGYTLDELLAGIQDAFGIKARRLTIPDRFLQLTAKALGASKLYAVAQRDLIIDDTAFRIATGWSPPVAWPKGLVR